MPGASGGIRAKAVFWLRPMKLRSFAKVSLSANPLKRTQTKSREPAMMIGSRRAPLLSFSVPRHHTPGTDWQRGAAKWRISGRLVRWTSATASSQTPYQTMPFSTPPRY